MLLSASRVGWKRSSEVLLEEELLKGKDLGVTEEGSHGAKRGRKKKSMRCYWTEKERKSGNGEEVWAVT